jgi:hypothetical protein
LGKTDNSSEFPSHWTGAGLRPLVLGRRGSRDTEVWILMKIKLQDGPHPQTSLNRVGLIIARAKLCWSPPSLINARLRPKKK